MTADGPGRRSLTSRALTLLLCAYLLAWVPASFAAELLTTLPSLGRRGSPAILELTFHGLAAMAAAGAGWMLLIRAPAARGAGIVAVVVVTLAAMQSLLWSALPRDVAPGQALPRAGLACAAGAFWLGVIVMRRV